HSFEIFGSVGLVWAIAWYIWFRDDPHNHSSVNADELQLIGTETPKPHVAVPWRDLIRNRSLFFLCVMYCGVIYGWYFYLTLLPTYLMESRGFDLSKAGFLSSLPLLSIGFAVF